MTVVARSSQATLILMLGAVAVGCVTPGAAAVPPFEDTFTFEEYEVELGRAERLTVLTGFLLGGATAEIATVSIDGAGERRLGIFTFDGGGWESELDASLGRDVQFVDVASIGGRDRLITFRPGRLSWFDPDSATQRLLIEVEAPYNAEPSGLYYNGAQPTDPFDEGEIPRVDVTRDLNRDGRDDLVMPAVDGFWISTQSSDGSFTDPVKLGPPEPLRDRLGFREPRSYGSVGISALTVPWYLGRIHEMDYNQDGRSDLVFWNDGRFEVHLQKESGGFDPVAETFTTEVSFAGDGAYSFMFGLEDKGTLVLALGLRKKSERTVLHSFRDMNADGVADLVTLTLSGRSLIRQRTRYDVHYGQPTADGIVFAEEVSTAIRPRARSAWGYSQQWLQDIDGDGQVDAVCGHIKTSFTSMVRVLVGRSLSMGLEVYRIDDGAYPEKADTKRKLTARLRFGDGRDAGFFPAVRVGDVNGDGRSDVVAGKSRETLLVFLGVPGPEVLTPQPREVTVTLPGDERNTWLTDLNRDGKDDILMHHPSTTEPHRVTMLIGR